MDEDKLAVGSLRAGEARREEIISRLKRAQADGHFEPGVFEARLEKALHSWHEDDLSYLVSDLPVMRKINSGSDDTSLEEYTAYTIKRLKNTYRLRVNAWQQLVALISGITSVWGLTLSPVWERSVPMSTVAGYTVVITILSLSIFMVNLIIAAERWVAHQDER